MVPLGIWGKSLQPITAYLRLYWGILNKQQGKAVTQSEKLEWWIILMVDCVTILEVEIEQNGYTQSTIKIIHHLSFSDCVTTFT